MAKNWDFLKTPGDQMAIKDWAVFPLVGWLLDLTPKPDCAVLAVYDLFYTYDDLPKASSVLATLKNRVELEKLIGAIKRLVSYEFYNREIPKSKLQGFLNFCKEILGKDISVFLLEV